MSFSQDTITKLAINDFDRSYSIMLYSDDSTVRFINPCHLSPTYKDLRIDSSLLSEIKSLYLFYNRNFQCMYNDPDSVFIYGGNMTNMDNVKRDSIKKNRVRLYFLNTEDEILYYKELSKKRFYRKLKKLLKEGGKKELYDKILYDYKNEELKGAYF